MARPVGSPLTKDKVKLFIPEEWVLKDGKRRYVFIGVLQPKVFRLSQNMWKSNKLAARFSQLIHRKLYNLATFYGLCAIDIDEPQRKTCAVSLELTITIGEGQDEVEKIA
jgi:hypothetical protein